MAKIRQIQQDLLNSSQSVGNPNDCQSQVEQIQELLRVRLTELKTKRDHVRSLGKLDSAAVSQIAAEKLALELTIAEQLFSIVKEPGVKDSLRDAHWTVQKLAWLKRKLSGEKSIPALEQSTTFGTYCAALAERLSAIAAVSGLQHSNVGGRDELFQLETSAGTSTLPPYLAEQLAEDEREMSVLFSKYKEVKLQELAALLAHETLRMGDTASADNQLIEEVKVIILRLFELQNLCCYYYG